MGKKKKKTLKKIVSLKEQDSLTNINKAARDEERVRQTATQRQADLSIATHMETQIYFRAGEQQSTLTQRTHTRTHKKKNRWWGGERKQRSIIKRASCSYLLTVCCRLQPNLRGSCSSWLQLLIQRLSGIYSRSAPLLRHAKGM